ncbi:MAG: hypothetical protein M3Q27_11585 [Actinomycetota bacterium]|nr:hypothetical protein [Actinomycetota bacterium]
MLGDSGGLLDAAIAAVAIGVVVWATFLGPRWTRPASAAWARGRERMYVEKRARRAARLPCGA